MMITHEQFRKGYFSFGGGGGERERRTTLTSGLPRIFFSKNRGSQVHKDIFGISPSMLQLPNSPKSLPTKRSILYELKAKQMKNYYMYQQAWFQMACFNKRVTKMVVGGRQTGEGRGDWKLKVQEAEDQIFPNIIFRGRQNLKLET